MEFQDDDHLRILLLPVDIIKNFSFSEKKLDAACQAVAIVVAVAITAAFAILEKVKQNHDKLKLIQY